MSLGGAQTHTNKPKSTSKKGGPWILCCLPSILRACFAAPLFFSSVLVWPSATCIAEVSVHTINYATHLVGFFNYILLGTVFEPGVRTSKQPLRRGCAASVGSNQFFAAVRLSCHEWAYARCFCHNGVAELEPSARASPNCLLFKKKWSCTQAALPRQSYVRCARQTGLFGSTVDRAQTSFS